MVPPDEDPYRPPDGATPEPPARGPGLLTAILAVVFTGGGVIAAGLLVARHHGGPLAMLLAAQSSVLLVVACTLLAGWWTPAACGMGRPRPAHLLGAIGLAPALTVGACILGGLTCLLLGPPPPAVAKIEEVLGSVRQQYGWAVLAAVACIVPGIAEEALMRGIVLTGLRTRCSPGAAVVFAALAFACLHLSPWRFLPQLGLGLATGWLALRTGSCWPGAATHALFNLLALLVASGGPRGAPTAVLILVVAAPFGLFAARALLRTRT